MDPQLVHRLGNRMVDAEPSVPRTVLAGDPRQAVSNLFTDTTGQFFAGLWESSPGKWPVEYTENEFCYLLAGRVILTGEDGRSATFDAGDAFVVAAGFKGTWEVVEPTRKYYAIFEPTRA